MPATQDSYSKELNRVSIFEAPEYDDHEQVLFVSEPSVGLRGIIAIHDTTLGPALGGCRMWNYETEADAIRDVLRLSRGMTHKSAILDCNLGGGKSVIIGDPYTEKTPQLLHAMGRWINSLGERYIVGEDIGTNPDDMREIAAETRCVSCRRVEDGGYGDPARFTALGVFSAMRAGIEQALGNSSFDGVRVAVQGIGNVGTNLCRLLHEAGANLTITDITSDRCKPVSEEFGADIVDPEQIYSADVQVFAPCAMGAILNDKTIPQLNARVIAGAANNQLEEARHGEALAERGITYMPDYVANGGGLVSCAAEWYRTDIEDVPMRVGKIYDTCSQIIARANAEGTTTAAAADRIAAERIKKGKRE
jgi:leucine dehydrogenase